MLASATTNTKNEVLKRVAALLSEQTAEIIEENRKDLNLAASMNVNTAMQDRLLLDKLRIAAMVQALEEIILLPDPIGRIVGGDTRPNGLEIIKKTVPLGVVGIIYESRPNVTIDCAALCLKSGNACILKGGKEAHYSNAVLVKIIQKALLACGLPEDCVQLVENPTRSNTTALMNLQEYIDVLIPRGGKGLIQTVLQESKVPVIETGAGVCHLYVHCDADPSTALEILKNAKMSRPSVCNAVETLLVHRSIAETFLPMAAAQIGPMVELRGCVAALPLLGTDAVAATAQDWQEEYNDYILAVRVVDSLEDAIRHIREYSTKHSEIIITNNYKAAEQFASQIDAAAIYINASSRFTDGGEFGFGAEIGISTQKLHVRGPMGLAALTSYKYIVHGNGQIRT